MPSKVSHFASFESYSETLVHSLAGPQLDAISEHQFLLFSQLHVATVLPAVLLQFMHLLKAGHLGNEKKSGCNQTT